MNEQEYSALPQEVKNILDVATGDESYEDCEQIKTNLNAIGWTCEYDLSASIYDVKQLEKGGV